QPKARKETMWWKTLGSKHRKSYISDFRKFGSETMIHSQMQSLGKALFRPLTS
ncbi:hypothetical protein HispidOSU_020111, partial [Sigmodon hispidus]